MIKPLHLIVRTPAKTILDIKEVTRIQAQLADGGGIGIHAGHAPLLAETITAPLVYANEKEEHSLNLEAGILQIAEGTVTIYTSGSSEADIAEQKPNANRERFERLAQVLLATLKPQLEGEATENERER